MTLNEAKAVLRRCERHELRDHAFGDVEINWVLGSWDYVVAFCYLGSGADRGISLYDVKGETTATFDGAEAQELRACGTLVVTRNDETGPDEFAVGQVMPGLTLEGVKKELTETRRCDNCGNTVR